MKHIEPTKKLYFVSARRGWQTVCAGHWLAPSAKAAKEMLAAWMASQSDPPLPGDVTLHARLSSADPQQMAVNL